MARGTDRATEHAPRAVSRSWIGPALVLFAILIGLGVGGFLRWRATLPGAAPMALAPEGEASLVAWVDPADARLEGAPAWADPRWIEHLQALLARQEPFVVGTQGALEPLAEALAELSFVERVERCELSDEGQLVLDLLLRRPVACIPSRGEFALVDEHGVVLEGRWPVPPRLGRAFLPVLGPRDDELYDAARSGDWLSEPEHLDALDVARSLARELGEEERASLGRIEIDARQARRASVENPGVRLELEGGRVALFGRAPGAGEPGELASVAKWRSLALALERFESDPVGMDWSLVDLRWDRPDLALRNAPQVAALLPDAPRRRAGSERVVPEPDPSRPRVR